MSKISKGCEQTHHHPPQPTHTHLLYWQSVKTLRYWWLPKIPAHLKGLKFKILLCSLINTLSTLTLNPTA